MARFVQLPSGTVFAQKPLQFSTPLQGSNLTTKDVVDILNVAEAVGKSESIGALASKAKENIGAAYEGVKGLFGGEEKKPAEAGTTQPTSDEIRPSEGMERKERRDLEGGSVFNKAAQAATKPADVEQKVDNTKVAPPVNTEGTGAVLPPPSSGAPTVPDKDSKPAEPVRPVIPPPPSVVVAPPTSSAEKPTDITPLVKQAAQETKAPEAPKQETDQERLQRYLNNRVEIGVNPPQINPDGSVNLQDQQRFFREVLAKGDKEEAALAKPPVASGAMPPAAPVVAAPTIDQAAAARVAAAKPTPTSKPAEQPKVEIKLGEPIAGNRFYDLRKEPDKVATEIAAMAAQGFKARNIEQYIKEYQKFGTTELDYYNMIGALKAAKESLPADSTERTKLNVEENQLREKVKKALEDKGLKYDEGKVPKLTPAKTTSQGDALYEQAVAKFMDKQPLTDAEKFALAGGPANEKAPQPSAAPKAKKTVGATGVETKELKQAAIPGPRPTVEVPPAAGATSAGAIPKGAAAKGAVVRASGAAVPPVEAAKPGVAQPGFKVDAKTVEQAGAAAAGAAGEKAAEQVARTEAQPQADFRQKFDDLLSKFPTKETKPVPATAEIVNRDLLAKGDPDAILAMVQKKLQDEEQAGTLKIPDKVSYQQLLSYARKATTPANQALVLEAFQRATGKPPPKTLVEMYNGDNETRAIAMLEAAFPAKAQEADAYTKQLKYAQAYKAVADSIKQVQAAQTDQAREAGLTQRAYRTEVEVASGDVSANLANKLAQAESRLEGAGLSAEKARETRELVELRKAAMAATVAAKVAEFDNKYNYKIALMRAGGGGGGKKGEKIKPELEWKIKDSTYKDSIDEQRKIVANLQNQATRRKVIPTQIRELISRRQDAINQGPAFAPNVSAYDTRIAELQGELDSLPTTSELNNQIALEVGALKELENRKAGLTDEFLGRKEAVAPAPVSVPLTRDSKGGPQSAGQKGQTGKGPTTKGKGQ